MYILYIYKHNGFDILSVVYNNFTQAMHAARACPADCMLLRKDGLKLYFNFEVPPNY